MGKKNSKKNSEKKCLAVPKKIERGDSLVSPGLVCYAEKQVKPFWFSSLDQIVHFGAIIFCRTFVELFWSVRVDRKKKSHYNSRVSLHEAPTKNDYQSSTLLHAFQGSSQRFCPCNIDVIRGIYCMKMKFFITSKMCSFSCVILIVITKAVMCIYLHFK